MAVPVRSRMSVFLVALTVGAVLSGCGGSEPADPFPDRPQDIDIAQLDPCTLLPPGEQARLDVEPGEPSENLLDEGARARNCGWNNFDTGVSYSVQLVGIDAGKAIGDDRLITVVGGFGAVRQVENVDSAPLCILVIDMNDGQMARILVRSTRYHDGRPRPIADVCDDASRLAETVILESRHLAS
ncbi:MULTISPECIES: DUF3558 domain-containing protein [unclassified Pseudonocardia]|uniref:DUF3558 domain-containing protein n=1 Tax=unclassified Pseudonocardia TaxID=2619320 RepID=UPI00095D4206|nr:DUF3558 domain-containing protein [Pseudonocardia sp. Ae707_Ps1]OLM21371.1 hypothetical protein Ae707Ps1_5630 [Pseudonocardia sp. Ae707_Ps1]